MSPSVHSWDELGNSCSSFQRCAAVAAVLTHCYSRVILRPRSWIDLGAAHRLGGFFDGWWPRLCAAGGLVAVHSTLTNQLTRDWLERVRALPKGPEGVMGDFEQVGRPCAANGLLLFSAREGQCV